MSSDKTRRNPPTAADADRKKEVLASIIRADTAELSPNLAYALAARKHVFAGDLLQIADAVAEVRDQGQDPVNSTTIGRLLHADVLTSLSDILARAENGALPEAIAEVEAEELIKELPPGAGIITAAKAPDLGPCLKISACLSVDTTKDPNCVIGFRNGKTLRYLCKGKSAWLIGPSGVGKSSLICEFAIGWALGKPVFGIEPVRPLKSLIIQAENDDYDIAEMVQGICSAHKLTIDDEWDDGSALQAVDDMVLFKTESTCVREQFVDRLHSLINREKPDIVWADPLLSFAGVDVTKTDQASMFLREWLNPVLLSTGAILFGVHHTGKPKSQRETQNWTALDYAYSGLGSSELVNWARAIAVMRSIDDTHFELKLAKRGRRAGATHPDGTWTTSVWLQHSRESIRWEQIAPPAEPEPKEEKKKGPKSKVAALATSNLHEVLSKCPPEGESANALGERFHAYSRKIGKTLGLTKCRTDLLDALVENGKIKFNGDLYFKGDNA